MPNTQDSQLHPATSITKPTDKNAKRGHRLNAVDIGATLGFVAACATIASVAPGLPEADALARASLSLGFDEGIKAGRGQQAN